MKQKVTYIILFLMFTSTIYSQTNLVPNGDFEMYDTCPRGISGTTFTDNYVHYALGWNDPTLFSADYFNVCAPTNVGFGIGVGSANVPYNGWGYQYAHSGDAYAGFGIQCCNDTGSEYIETKLAETLQPNTSYCLEAYLSRADSEFYATNNIGFLFTANAISNLGATNLYMYTPQATSGNTIIRDAINWVKIIASFTLTTPCNYLTIGRFYPTTTGVDEIIIQGQSTINGGNYYYIDDIKVWKCDDSTVIPPPPIIPSPPVVNPPVEELSTIPNVFSPNNDGVNDEFYVSTNTSNQFKINIYNRWGTLLFESNQLNFKWDGRTGAGEICTEGVYYYILELNNNADKSIKPQGFIILMR